MARRIETHYFSSKTNNASPGAARPSAFRKRLRKLTNPELKREADRHLAIGAALLDEALRRSVAS